MVFLREKFSDRQKMVNIVVGRDLEDTKKFGSEGTINIGKHIVGSGEDAHFTTPVLMDVLRPHLIVLCGKRGCVTKDTEITTDKGKKLITEFNHEDKVYSYNLATKKFEWRNAELIKYNIDRDEKLVKITHEKGSITATIEHPLLVIDNKKIIWKEAKFITEKDKLISNNNEHVNIKKIEENSGYDKVYDLSVSETHSFIASDVVSSNSGKSYSLGVFIEELMRLPDEYRKKLCSLMVDTQGIFWTMKQPNEKEAVSLNSWGLKPEGFNIKVYVPEGQSDIFSKSGVDFDGVFSVSPSELSGEDWLSVFELSPSNSIGILLQKVINDIKNEKESYNIDDIVVKIKKSEGFESEKLALENRFYVTKGWGIFGDSKMPEILESGKSTVLDVSLTPQNVRALLVSIVCNKILKERIIARRKEELAETEGSFIKRVPICWVFIDEAHNFISADTAPASQDVLLRIVKEGRQPGIGLVLATQRPEKLHQDSLAQSDLLISHMLTSKADIDSLRSVMQTYMLFDITKYFTDLPKMKGVGIVLDDSSERIYSIYVRPRQSWHAGSSPVAKV